MGGSALATQQSEEEETISAQEIQRYQSRAASGTAEDDTLVVTLDPGHGGADPGANRKWNGKTVNEKDLNLKIALYCKEELETYSGVQVYMTRDTDVRVGLVERVEYAASVQSDVLVSLHNNAADRSGTTAGAEVLIPNGNYRPQLTAQAKKLGGNILTSLHAATGVKNLGFLQRDNSTQVYPDGSKADYYAVIRNGVLMNIPAIIVEHAFLDSTSDFKKYLSTDSALQALGKADAAAIAETYGLVKKHTAAANGDAPFTDVYETDWSYPAIVAAYQNGTAAGISATQFAPKRTCTRAEAVTFLWSAAGKPEAAAAQQFQDVKAGDWYAQAVAWAAAEGITAGTTETTFSPNKTCSRAEIVTFLWSAAGKPEAEENPFADVSPDAWYCAPVTWAASTGVTSGTSATTFSPDAPCTREQIVTFLYKSTQ